MFLNWNMHIYINPSAPIWVLRITKRSSHAVIEYIVIFLLRRKPDQFLHQPLYAFFIRLHKPVMSFPFPCSNRQLPFKSVTSPLCSSVLNIKHMKGYIMELVPWRSDVSRISKLFFFLMRQTWICKKLYLIFQTRRDTKWHKIEMNKRNLHGRKGRLREVFFCIS